VSGLYIKTYNLKDLKTSTAVTLPISPPEIGLNGLYPSKSALLSKKVCYKVVITVIHKVTKL